MSATVGFLMMYLINDCKPLGQDPTKFPTQVCYYVCIRKHANKKLF